MKEELSLNFRELRHAGWPVLALVLIGVPVGWAGATAAAYYGAGLSLQVSLLFGGILVVTGPTVVGPLLRSMNIGHRVKDILRWEAIINDPIGTILAVGVYAWIIHGWTEADSAKILIDILGACFIATLIGVGLGFTIAYIFARGLVPEYLKAAVLLVTVIGGFVLADLVMHETGLITVTVMGMVLANRRTYSSAAIRRFKEELAVLLISGVFILLSATLTWDVMAKFQARFLIFLLLLLFVVRPLMVMSAMLFTRVPWRERLFMSWIAPRGIVATAITGLFAIRLQEHGVPDAEALVPLSFGVVIATIFAHGFTAKLWARRLGLDRGPGGGVLLIGANDWTIGLASLMKSLDIRAVIVDPSKFALRAATKAEIETVHGDILNEQIHDAIDFTDYGAMIAATDNPAYNALICADIGPEMGFDKVAQAGSQLTAGMHLSRGQVLLKSGPAMDELLIRAAQGWVFTKTTLSDRFSYSDYRKKLRPGGEPLALLRPGKPMQLFSTDVQPTAEAGDVVISFQPPEGFTPPSSSSQPALAQPSA